MHGHHPHLIARDFHVALDLRVGAAQPGDKTLQRRRLAALVIEREVEEFVERVGCLRAEAGKVFSPSALGPEHARIEGKRRVALCHRGKPFELRRGIGERGIVAGLGAQRRVQRPGAVPGERDAVIARER